jgi:hypothetical protein
VRAQFPQDSESALTDLGPPGDIHGVATPAFIPPGEPTLTGAQRIQRAGEARISLGAPAASKHFPLNISLRLLVQRKGDNIRVLAQVKKQTFF